jgi:damage-control phosphatase, subfamily III
VLIVDQDLSLLTHLSEDDIHHLQSVGKDAQAARKQFILKDDQEAIWNHIQSLRGDQVDFVLDNCAPSFPSSNGIQID